MSTYAPSTHFTEHPGAAPDAPFDGADVEWTASGASEHAGEASVGDTDAAAARVLGADAEDADRPHGLKGTFERFVKRPLTQFVKVAGVPKEVARDAKAQALHPETEWVGALRRSNTLSDAEQAFLHARLSRLTGSRRNGGLLASYMKLEDLDEEVLLEDIPVIALGGSGGGMRANLGFGAVMEAMQADGLWALLAYVAGVSGSCWAIAAFYTWGACDFGRVMDHFESSANHHPLSRTAVQRVADAPGGVYQQWGPNFLKMQNGVHLTLLDLYGTFMTSYMWLPVKPDSEGATPTAPELKREWFHWSRVWKSAGIESGQEPLPILTAVRHERPWKDWKDPTEPFANTDVGNDAEHQAAQDAWWQWFELSPLEVGCDELEGWIPTWSFGRAFSGGQSLQRLPEQSLSLLLGLATSAPAGPLSSYLGTVGRNLPQNVFGDAIKFLAKGITREWGPQGTERFEDHHPIHAANEPNPFFHALAEEGRGNGIENSPRVHLIDSGMANNCPTHVFCHPARSVDIVLNFDASSDVQKGAALDRINDFGTTKGLRFTPREHLAPLRELPKGADGQPTPLGAADTAARFRGRYAQMLDGEPVGPQTGPRDALPAGWRVKPLGAGGAAEVVYNARHQPQAARGVRMVYMPLLPHAVAPAYDPSTAKFSSSYNLVWTAAQVRTIRATAQAGYREGLETVRALVREVYEEKKARRRAGG